jgi:hypothetical protein
MVHCRSGSLEILLANYRKWWYIIIVGFRATIELSNEILQKPLNPNIKKYKLYGKIMTYVTNKTKINKKI